MDWNRIEGNWKLMSGRVKEQWGQLTEDDITQINGKREQLEGKIQERYGRAKDDVRRDIGAGAFIQLYVTLLGSYAVVLTAEDGGQWWTLGFIIVVVATDVGAYATGVSFGKHPMAPRISPKKTWEGFAGSFLAALIAGVLVSMFMLGEHWTFGLLFGSVILVTATVGDLAESMIKRDLEIKDISSWLPGHGGFLDRLDSILPSAAAAYGLFLLFG